MATWVYNQNEMEYVKVDANNNIIREYYENGVLYKYYKYYGYQPSTFKECSTPQEQLEYCKSVKCPNCNYCVWAENMHLTPKNKPKKQKLIQTEEVISKFDNLAKNVVKVSEEFDHPLYHEIIRVFKKQ